MSATSATTPAMILARVRPRKNRPEEPIALSTGRRLLSCSEAFQRAVEACRDTTSQRACMSVGAISSPICSATRQPNGTLSLPGSVSGRCSRVTITAFEPDSST